MLFNAFICVKMLLKAFQEVIVLSRLFLFRYFEDIKNNKRIREIIFK